jgi:uncharacterized protein involved in type VI secretion and phage assembly
MTETTECRTFFGKYRGSVVNNIDPEQRGRIQVQVADVSAAGFTAWAMPCLPVGGQQMGFFTVPPMGSGVWVEFEQGDLDCPVWVGAYWGGSSELPPLAKQLIPGQGGVVLQTTGQNGLMLSDLPGPTGGLMVKSAAGASLIVNDTGIFLDNGKGAKIELVGNMVKINDTALTVT